LHGQTFKLQFWNIIYRYVTPLTKGSEFYRYSACLLHTMRHVNMQTRQEYNAK